MRLVCNSSVSSSVDAEGFPVLIMTIRAASLHLSSAGERIDCARRCLRLVSCNKVPLPAGQFRDRKLLRPTSWNRTR